MLGTPKHTVSALDEDYILVFNIKKIHHHTKISTRQYNVNSFEVPNCKPVCMCMVLTSPIGSMIENIFT